MLYWCVGEVALGKVINLNKFRKRKAKLEREKQAEANRRLHGRSAAERARDELQKRQLTRAVDGAKLESDATLADPDEASEGDPDPSA